MKGWFVMGEEAGFKVDFFCIGAPKCGSTWLARCVGEHPGISVARIKEPNFFVRTTDLYGDRPNKLYLHSWEWYKGLFDPGRKCGDFSVNLLYGGRDTAELIRRYFPQARFIVALRDPVARAYSHYWYDRAASEYDAEAAAGFPASFEAALTTGRLRESGRYYARLSEWLAVFGAQAFHVVTDIDIRKDSLAVLRNIFVFVGVDPGFVPPSLNIRVNEAFTNRFLYVVMKRWSGRLKKTGLVRLINAADGLGLGRLAEKAGKKPASSPPINPETERELRLYYRDDIEKLETLLGRDLTEWKTGGR